MKYELPIAITLLAAGCLLWMLQSESSSQQPVATIAAPVSALNQPKTPRFDSRDTQAAPAWQPPTTVQHASHSQDIAWEPPNVRQNDAVDAAGAVRSIASKPIANQSPLTMNGASQLLADIAALFRDGAASTGAMEIESELFGKQHRVSARFWQAGQGSGKSRIELIPQIKNPVKVTQVCDGRTLYRLMQRGEKKQLTFMRLDQLKNEDAGLIQATLPATWVGSGSIDKLFFHLAEAFDFGQPQATADGSQFELTGTWRPAFLAKLMINHIDHRKLTPKVQWDLLPPQMPHGVKIVVSNRNGDVWFPETVTFFQFQTSDSSQSQIGMAMSIRFSEIQQQPLGPELFTMQANDVPAVNETGMYNERIGLMAGRDRVAAGSPSDVR